MAGGLWWGLVLGALAGKSTKVAKDVSKDNTELLEAKSSMVDLLSLVPWGDINHPAIGFDI